MSESRKSRASRPTTWTSAQIDATRAAIKAELDAIAAAEGEEQAVRTAMHRLATVSDDVNSESQLQAYVYIMSALVRFLRCGRGITLNQVQAFVDRVYTIMKLMRFRLDNTRISYLFGDLHAVVSQIYLRSGDIFAAAWEHQLALRLYKGGDARSVGFQTHNAGVRALRRGDAKMAVELFAEAEGHSSEAADRIKSGMAIAKAHRLSGRLDFAQEVQARVKAQHELNQSAELEWIWEHALWQAQSTNDLAPMMQLVRRGKSHFQGRYLLEALLWAYAGQKTAPLEELSSVQSIKRSWIVEIDAQAPLTKLLSTLDKVYDTDYPLEHRLQLLGKALARVSTLESIELELLYWLAATRWLVRSRAFGAAQTVFAEYRALSLRLSGGVTGDALGLAEDLLNRIEDSSGPVEAAS